MAMIYVRTKPGRRAYFEGRIIPEDKFIPVTDDPYIRRLLHHWEDLEEEGGGAEATAEGRKGKKKGPTPKAAAEPSQPVTKRDY